MNFEAALGRTRPASCAALPPLWPETGAGGIYGACPSRGCARFDRAENQMRFLRQPFPQRNQAFTNTARWAGWWRNTCRDVERFTAAKSALPALPNGGPRGRRAFIYNFMYGLDLLLERRRHASQVAVTCRTCWALPVVLLRTQPGPRRLLPT